MARLEDKFRDRALASANRSAAIAAAASSAAVPGESAPQQQLPQQSPISGLNPLAGQPRATLTELPINQIERDPSQPRTDLGDLTDLKASIASVGLIQPIIVTILGYERYRLVAGERRYTAAKELGLAKIPSIVRTLEEHLRLEVQIVENLHRKDLNPVEEAQSYKRLMEEFGLTQEQVAGRIGKSRPAINEILRVLTLPHQILEECRTSDIRKSLLLEIAKRPASEQLGLWEQAKGGDLTVRKAREKKIPEKTRAPQPFAPMNFRYPIQTEEAVVTVVFERPSARPEEIIAALEEALYVERVRARGTMND